MRRRVVAKRDAALRRMAPRTTLPKSSVVERHERGDAIGAIGQAGENGGGEQDRRCHRHEEPRYSCRCRWRWKLTVKSIAACAGDAEGRRGRGEGESYARDAQAGESGAGGGDVAQAEARGRGFARYRHARGRRPAGTAVPSVSTNVELRERGGGKQQAGAASRSMPHRGAAIELHGLPTVMAGAPMVSAGDGATAGAAAAAAAEPPRDAIRPATAPPAMPAPITIHFR